MQILIPNVCVPNTYVHDFAFAMEQLGHQIIWGNDNIFYSQFAPDAIVSHWPEGYLNNRKELNPSKLETLRHRLELWRKQTVIIAIVHNVKPRETGDRQIDAKLKNLFEISYAAAHGFVHLGRESIKELQEYYPDCVYKDKPTLIVSHGLNELLKSQNTPEAKQIDRSNEFRIFVPGTIRNWSELNLLIRAFLKAFIPQKKLVIAGGGTVFTGKHPLKIVRSKLVRSIPNTILFGRRLSDRALAEELMSANIIIAPRLWATNSGIPYLAATYGKRCLGPKVGNIPEALDELNGILFEPDNPSSLAKAMETAYQQNNLAFVPTPPCPSWREIIQEIEKFISSLKKQVLSCNSN